MPQQPVQAMKAAAPPAPSGPAAHAENCRAIARDLDVLTRQYPQLADYRAVDWKACKIHYAYRTHRATTRGGWSSGVPHPDDDGIWFYLGIWDPADPTEASAQIHTQPVTADWWIGERRVTFLILEGKGTTRASGAIVDVLRRHGLRDHK